MATSTQQIPRRRSRIGPALACLCVLLAALYLFRRPRMERLLAFDGYAPTHRSIHNGALIWTVDPSSQGADNRSQGTVIYARALPGGAARVVTKLAPDDMLVGDIFPVGDELIYSLLPRPKPRPQTSQIYSVMSAQPNQPRYLGEFLKSPYRLEAAELPRKQRTALAPTFYAGEETRMQRIALIGGAPRLLCRIEQGSSLVYQPDGRFAYWLRKHPDDSVWGRRGDDTWTEVTGHSELMVLSLRDGWSHPVCFGLPLSTSLRPGTAGVFWWLPHTYPDKGRDLYYYQADDQKVTQVHGYDDDTVHFGAFNGEISGYPVEYRGRLYWVVSGPSQMNRTADGYYQEGGMPNTVVSANKDGSDRRQTLAFDSRKRRTMMVRLIQHRGALYCVQVVSTSSQAGAGANALYLSRIRPDRREPLEDLCMLPAGAQAEGFDGDYFYFDLPDKQRSLWQMLTGDDSAAATGTALYRIRLPD
jgi:hypothetical protein